MKNEQDKLGDSISVLEAIVSVQGRKTFDMILPAMHALKDYHQIKPLLDEMVEADKKFMMCSGNVIVKDNLDKIQEIMKGGE